MKTIPLDRIIKDRKKDVIKAVQHLHKENEKEIIKTHTFKILKHRQDGVFKLEELINNKQFTTPENIKLIKGNVFETVPAFLENNQNIKLACIHLDMDVYEPTKYCLDLLFPFLQENGIIICDDYNQVDGATKAFDEFSEKHGKNISKLEFSKTPYFIENN